MEIFASTETTVSTLILLCKVCCMESSILFIYIFYLKLESVNKIDKKLDDMLNIFSDK